MTAEKNCLKLWKLDNPISIGKRLHLKTDVIDVKYASNVSLFVILFATGVVMTVTHTGRTL